MITDGWPGYGPLIKAGYLHDPHVQKEPADAMVVLPRVHLVFSNLKSWLLGTHYAVSNRHISNPT